jgi:hypothetical protein
VHPSLAHALRDLKFLGRWQLSASIEYAPSRGLAHAAAKRLRFISGMVKGSFIGRRRIFGLLTGRDTVARTPLIAAHEV